MNIPACGVENVPKLLGKPAEPKWIPSYGLWWTEVAGPYAKDGVVEVSAPKCEDAAVGPV